MILRIVSNFEHLGRARIPGQTVQLDKYPAEGRFLALRVLSVFWKSFGADYIVLNGRSTDLFALAILRTLFPVHRCRLVSVDLMLSTPGSVTAWILHWIKVFALRNVDLFILYYRNTRGYENAFRISKDKIRFVPFKVNALEIIRRIEIMDHGYVFSGGVSRRDYETFLRAASALPVPVKMIIGTRDVLAEHDSLFDESLVPANVEIIPGCSLEEFLRSMAYSRLVVVVLKEHPVAPAGLSVCLQAMALRKCVIVSAVPSVESSLPDDTAILVPPGDPDALKEAIERVYHDEDLRERIAEAGFRYAMKLGGEDRLMASILEVLEGERAGSRRVAGGR